jgi:dinuclear metal center YbgI/SA1388 family protein
LKCQDIIHIVERIAPPEYAENWDNSGFLCGERDAEITGVLISLDYTEDTLKEAVSKGCNMVISHHPFIFSTLSAINSDTPVGRLIMDTCKMGVNVYAAHTSLDYADGGTNDVLFDLLGLKNKDIFMPVNNFDKGLGRVGYTGSPVRYMDFVKLVKDKLKLKHIKYIGNPQVVIHKVALLTGAGAVREFIAQAVKCNADAYVTGDLKYHDALDALALGLNIIDGTHFATEIIVCDRLKDMIVEAGGGMIEEGFVKVTDTGKQPFRYL